MTDILQGSVIVLLGYEELAGAQTAAGLKFHRSISSLGSISKFGWSTWDCSIVGEGMNAIRLVVFSFRGCRAAKGMTEQDRKSTLRLDGGVGNTVQIQLTVGNEGLTAGLF